MNTLVNEFILDTKMEVLKSELNLIKLRLKEARTICIALNILLLFTTLFLLLYISHNKNKQIECELSGRTMMTTGECLPLNDGSNSGA